MLCKCSGKYIDIYFILKITFFYPSSFHLCNRIFSQSYTYKSCFKIAKFQKTCKENVHVYRKSLKVASADGRKSDDSSDDSLSSVALSLLGGKAGKKMFRQLITEVMRDTKKEDEVMLCLFFFFFFFAS